MRKIIVHNPTNEYTKKYRYYNYFWDRLTSELKNRYEVTENRYFENAHSDRWKVSLKNGISDDFLLLECEYVIEMEDTGDFYILSVADTPSHAILNEQDNPFLKKVLLSQFEKVEVENHVRKENLHKYFPWIYFQAQIINLSPYYEKRKQYDSSFKDKLFFRGTMLEDRPILNYFNDTVLEGILPTNPESYFNELITYKLGLSIAGRGQLCYRDIEYMAVGVPFIRFQYTAEINPNLKPNYHYISVERPTDLLKDRLGNKEHADMIINRFFEVKDDEDFLSFVAKNAKKYYDTYLAEPNNVLHTLNLLEL